MDKRYMVQSEHIRGERRVYYVIDLKLPGTRGSGGTSVTEATTDKRTAQRQCDKLNGFSTAK